jgi:hypothetical protein
MAAILAVNLGVIVRKSEGAWRLVRLYAEKDEPQPQVDVAFGFLITNCAPSMLS